jgi:hypothetical protein
MCVQCACKKVLRRRPCGSCLSQRADLSACQHTVCNRHKRFTRIVWIHFTPRVRKRTKRPPCVHLVSLTLPRGTKDSLTFASWVHKVSGDRSERVLTMSSWYQVTPKRKEKLGKDRANLQRKALTKAQLEKFCRASRLRNAVMMVTTTRGSALNITTLSRIAAAIPSMSTTRSMSA